MYLHLIIEDDIIQTTSSQFQMLCYYSHNDIAETLVCARSTFLCTKSPLKCSSQGGILTTHKQRKKCRHEGKAQSIIVLPIGIIIVWSVVCPPNTCIIMCNVLFYPMEGISVSCTSDKDIC